jgi:transcriptional regulator with XRE-family HTH domain
LTIIQVLIIIIYIMGKKLLHIYPGPLKEMSDFGQRLKDARLRRRFSMETVCARVGISRPTLGKIEKGDPSVAFGIYTVVLRVLGLLDDLSLVAKEDKLGRLLQDESLPQRKRSPRRMKPPQQKETPNG